jgi:hypothetical protein
MSVTPEVPRAGFVSAWIRRPQLLAAACWALLAGPAVTHAADIASAWAQLRQGEYEEVIDEALAVIDDPATPAEWHLLLAEALFTVGRYADAESAAVRGLRAGRRRRSNGSPKLGRPCAPSRGCTVTRRT